VMHVFNIVQHTWCVRHALWEYNQLRVSGTDKPAWLAGILYVPLNDQRSIARYDPVDNIWLSPLPMHDHVQEFGMAALSGCLVLIGGKNSGISGNVPMSAFDSQSPTGWLQVPDASLQLCDLACWGASASSFDGRLWLVGGMSASDEDRSTVTRLRTDSSRSVWVDAVAPMSEATRGLETCWCKGKLYALGGGRGDLHEDGRWPVTTFARYCPLSNSWESLAEMPTGRIGFTTAARKGEVYVLGGTATTADQEPVRTIDVYNSELDAWRTLPVHKDFLAATWARELEEVMDMGDTAQDTAQDMEAEAALMVLYDQLRVFAC